MKKDLKKYEELINECKSCIWCPDCKYSESGVDKGCKIVEKYNLQCIPDRYTPKQFKRAAIEGTLKKL